MQAHVGGTHRKGRKTILIIFVVAQHGNQQDGEHAAKYHRRNVETGEHAFHSAPQEYKAACRRDNPEQAIEQEMNAIRQLNKVFTD